MRKKQLRRKPYFRIILLAETTEEPSTDTNQEKQKRKGNAGSSKRKSELTRSIGKPLLLSKRTKSLQSQRKKGVPKPTNAAIGRRPMGEGREEME